MRKLILAIVALLGFTVSSTAQQAPKKGVFNKLCQSFYSITKIDN